MPRFFDPARQPYRDRYGFTAHPDLALFHDGETAINTEALRDAGFVLEFVPIESAAPGLLDAYLTGDEYALARWDPKPPPGDGWRLVGLGDTENDPVAVFVRPLS